MHNVAIEVLEGNSHGCLDVRGKLMGTFGGMKDLVVLFKQRSKCGTTHLETILHSGTYGGWPCALLLAV